MSKELEEENKYLKKILKWVAVNCEQWAKDSRDFGWSTHQVKKNLEVASKIRMILSADNNLEIPER